MAVTLRSDDAPSDGDRSVGSGDLHITVGEGVLRSKLGDADANVGSGNLYPRLGNDDADGQLARADFHLLFRRVNDGLAECACGSTGPRPGRLRARNS